MSRHLPMRFYHGSRTELQVGDWLLPAAETGAESCTEPPYYGEGDARLVYLTDSFSEACKFAVTRQLPAEEVMASPPHVSPRAFVGPGFVYEVQPRIVDFVGELQWHAGEYTCCAAQIIRVHKVPSIFVELRRRIEIYKYGRSVA